MSNKILERLLVLIMFPVKLPIFFIILAILPVVEAIHFATSPRDNPRYSEFLVEGFNKLVRFLFT